MMRTSVLRAFASPNGALGMTSRIVGAGFQRTFTSTARRNADIVAFNPSSSKELDDLLAEIRYKIILPSYLPQWQQKKIYSAKHEKALNSDPIIIEIDGEVFKFRHMKRLEGEVPHTRKSLNKVLGLFQTGQDWENVMPLLEGLYHAGRKIPRENMSKLIRKAGEAGQSQHIIDCARRVESTNLKLDSPRYINDILTPIQMAAARAHYSLGRTTSALRTVEQVRELLEDDKQKVPVKDNELPLAYRPTILLANLHLAAALTRKNQELGAEGADAAAAGVVKTVDLARQLLKVWPTAQSSLYDVETAAGHAEDYIEHPRKYLAVAAPLLRGLREAIAVLEPIDKELAAELSVREAPLAVELKSIATEAKASVGEGGKPPLGVTQWELLIER